MKRIKYNLPLLTVILLSLIFFVAYETMSIKRYNAHLTRGDLTNFSQAMWNTTQGRVMQNTFNYSIHNFWGGRTLPIPDDSNIFGVHFNPIILLFVPFYAVFPTPITLLTVQALLTAIGGIFIYLLVNQRLKQPIIGIVLAITYWLYYPLVSVVLYEFHAAALGMFFGLLMITLFEFRRYQWFLIMFGLFLLIQENAPIPAAFFGLYIFLICRMWRLGVVCMSVSIIYFMCVTQVFIPHLSNYHSFIFESAYGNALGNSFGQIITGGLHHPSLAFHVFFNKANFLYVGNLTWPLLPFGLLSPAMYIVGLAGVLPSIISSADALKSSNLHYDAFAIPFLFFATVLGLERLFRTYLLARSKFVVSGICLLFLVLTVVGYKTKTAAKLNPSLLRTPLRTQVDDDLDAAQAKIPADASLATQDYATAQLAHRRRLYLFPVHADNVAYLLLAKNDQTWPLSIEEHQRLMSQFIFNPGYAILYQNKNFIILKRRDAS